MHLTNFNTFWAIGLCLFTASLLPAQSNSKKPEGAYEEFVVYVGSGLEKPTMYSRSSIPKYHRFNLGVGYRYNVGNGWAVQSELWMRQLNTPGYRLVNNFHINTNTDRIFKTDTVSVIRVLCGSLELSMLRDLPLGFKVLGGLHLDHFSGALLDERRQTRQVRIHPSGTGELEYSSSYTSGYEDVPAWVRRSQFGIKLGLEKPFWKRFVLGVSIHQCLLDATLQGTGRPNRPTNWLGYVGYRI